jgi:phenylacetate-CoA ligase
MKSILKNWMKETPIPIRDITESLFFLLPPSIRYGKTYVDALNFFHQTESWNAEQFKAYQNQKLRQLILHVYEKVPYYRKIFDERSLKPADINTVEDLPKLPFLTKSLAREHIEELLPSDIKPGKTEFWHTSGTSEKPLKLVLDKSTVAWERAEAVRRLLWLGYMKGNRLAIVRGTPLTNPKRIFKYLSFNRELRISLMRSDEKSLFIAASELKRFEPDFITGWPSCIYLLATWMKRNNFKMPGPKYVLTSSENLYPHYRKEIESFFGAKVIDSYGQNEFVATAVQCSHGKGYHTVMEMGIIELIPYREPFYEIVGTSFYSPSMPLIRYKTGDLAIPSALPCICGRSTPTLASVVGKTSDLVIKVSGEDFFATEPHLALYQFEEIREVQIVMEDDDRIRVLIVPWDKLSQDTVSRLTVRLTEVFGSASKRLVVETVDEIRTAPSGKRQFVVARSREL